MTSETLVDTAGDLAAAARRGGEAATAITMVAIVALLMAALALVACTIRRRA